MCTYLLFSLIACSEVICPLRLQVAAWLELGGIVEGQDGGAEGGGEVGAAFASPDDDLCLILTLSYVRPRRHHQTVAVMEISVNKCHL